MIWYTKGHDSEAAAEAVSLANTHNPRRQQREILSALLKVRFSLICVGTRDMN
jgi:hypothetical protein